MAPHVEVYEPTRDEVRCPESATLNYCLLEILQKTLGAQVDRVYECERALDDVKIRPANLHHSNILVKTTDGRWFFVGFIVKGYGPDYTCKLFQIWKENRTESFAY